MRHLMYTLDGHTPVPVEDGDHVGWGVWFQRADRKVAQDVIGDVTVSTVFLAMDHGFDEGAPVLFETMIFGGEHDEYQERYRTWEEAEEGHKKALAMVKGETNDA